ncbi:hypothetical protein [Clostridium tertium]|uniref:hypothetical protein n=1 Tax=Clostridium tertium TaxID=1559 RepID=UPI00374E3448
MRNGKNKEEFKNKNFILISGLIAALIITVIGTIILNNKSNIEEKKQVVGEVNNNDKSGIEKQLKTQLENLKQMDIYKLSEGDRWDINNKIDSIEDMIDKKEYDKAKLELVNLTKYIEKEFMKIGNKEEIMEEEKSEEINDIISNNTMNGNEQNNGTAKNKPNDNNASSSNKHTHNWVPITKILHHDEVGHYEDVLVQNAWTEEVPIYEDKEVAICNGCGADITSDPWGHIEQQALAGNYSCGGFHTDWKQVQVGTNKINYNAVYEKKWVVDKAAWDETVTTGYKCSSCGETK